MRTFGLLLLCVLAAYWVDAHFYGGLYGGAVLTVARHVGHGILLGLSSRCLAGFPAVAGFDMAGGRF